MFAPSFDYYRAGAVREALALMQQHPGAKLLAGGHTLIPLLKLRLTGPTALIDIGRIPELKGITSSSGTIRIGALTTHAELAASPALRAECPMLSEAASQIGDAQVRNHGTIGGNVAHADPASDLPTVLVALDARFNMAGPKGERTVAAGDFFQGMMTTAIDAGEILTAVEIPSMKPGQGMAYVKFAHPASRYAVIGAAAVVTMKNGTCGAAQIAIGGLVPAPARLRHVENAVTGARPSDEMMTKAAAAVVQHLDGDILGDVFASAEYRKAVAPVYVKRALAAAVQRAS
ncbi:MAG: xanthine dehydrogenase family protein subunit M [Acidobacteria bacterium]|nr:MAG: xanthine dehydrogenase family protein subunit M [Acidobacteriota bacterium]